MPASPMISLSPESFSSFSNRNLADIAARVVEEFRAENGYDSDFFEEEEEDGVFGVLEGDVKLVSGDSVKAEGKDDGGDGEEVEFEFVPGGGEFSPISADEIFYNGEIRPIFPIFNRNLSTDCVNFNSEQTTRSNSGDERAVTNPPPKIRLPLRRLFNEELEPPPPRSSPEEDEIYGIPPGTYCVWRPNASPGKPSARMCEKSNSTGWSKRWKFRDLVHRSNSDGKDRFVFLSPSVKNGSQDSENPAAGEASNAAEKPRSPPLSGDKRRSYLTYKQDLVGFFAHTNGLSRSLQPF
ncbi:unnamed protein product [Cuscuta campestris]|uniref:DUF1645 domain-containing protein n=1 Tax=Cuscuta campestris TaxID=132261 RepID=A0A484N3K1_9ASTE|nr:unnamed protein product [Cuscuta campestris]